MTPELLNKLKHLANIAAHLPHDVTIEDEDAAMKALHGELAADTVLQMIALAEHTLLAAAPAPSMAVRDDAIQEVIGRLIKWETANGNDVYDADEVEELLALLQPQGQADTSGLPG